MSIVSIAGSSIYVESDGNVEKEKAEHTEESTTSINPNQVQQSYVPPPTTTKAKSQMDKYDDGETCMLDILDTAGQEEYSAMRDQYYRVGQGFIITYSITSRGSFDVCKQLYNNMKMVKDSDWVPAILVGNKNDLESEREVTTNEAIELAKELNIPFVETSAKTRENIENLFETLVRVIPREGTLYKIVIVGDGGVGKSAIVIQFTSNHFVQEYNPTIENSYRKQMKVQGLVKAIDTKKSNSKKSKRR